MNKNMSGRFCMVLPLAVILPACTGFDVMAECRNGPPAITINLQSSKIAVTPKKYCADPGEAIPVNIRPPKQQRNTVRTIAKPSNPDKPGSGNWLSRDNAPYDNLIIIQVPDRAAVDKHCPGPVTKCEYYYSVQAPGKAPLDPMITVRK